MGFIPPSMMPYLKSWIALLGAVATIVVTYDTGAKWAAILSSVATAIGVYLTPNAPAPVPAPAPAPPDKPPAA